MMDTADPVDHSDESMTGNKDKGSFYTDAANYWSQIPATVDGMLGGYGFISRVDINGSAQFLKNLLRLKNPPGRGRALDCGAGIGRISKDLLLPHFQQVDLVEQNPAFVAQARAALETHTKMGNFFCSGLQDFTPEPATYDVIWCQWVLSHLTDDDLIYFLRACIRGLKKDGVIILKENVASSNKEEVDSTDSSVTRPLHILCKLLQQAGLRCVKQKCQDNFPPGLYAVYMMATRPMTDWESRSTDPVTETVGDERVSVKAEDSTGNTIADEGPDDLNALRKVESSDNASLSTIQAEENDQNVAPCHENIVKPQKPRSSCQTEEPNM